MRLCALLKCTAYKCLKSNSEDICCINAATGYLEAVPQAEKPVVQFIARAKVTRNVRQGVLNRLAGQHLALAAWRAGTATPGAIIKGAELR